MITLNGKKLPWHQGLTIQELLEQQNEDFAIVVVKVNNKVISKKEYTTFEIPDNAEVNTVDIIAGG